MLVNYFLTIDYNHFEAQKGAFVCYMETVRPLNIVDKMTYCIRLRWARIICSKEQHSDLGKCSVFTPLQAFVGSVQLFLQSVSYLTMIPNTI